MSDQGLLLDGVRIPRLLYGTAWKEDRTQHLTELALEQGFRGIDTANQRRHYHEALVGKAIAAAMSRGLVSRDDLFLQTKFTFQRGQDHRLPYDPRAKIPIQVEQSFSSSLAHLGVETLNSFLLHGPTQREGLTADDWAAWKAMEAIHDSGRVRLLGVSNVTHQQLQQFVEGARIPPRLVQNRCYASRGWDLSVRQFCRDEAIVYQGFSLLTANRELLALSELRQIAEHHGRTIAQVVFRFAIEVGIVPLTGTTSADHMRADLAVFDFQLTVEEAALIEHLAVQ